MLRLRPLAFANFLVCWLPIGACSVGACGFWRLSPLHVFVREYDPRKGISV